MRQMAQIDVEDLAEQVMGGSRPHLARALTLVESSRPVDRERTRELLKLVSRHTGKAIRLGVSGVPGAGKSTFIDALGCRLVDDHHLKVAVLAVDPSSSQSGGSILGDRTRMGQLAERDDAFVRPSPSGGSLGGVARATRESMIIMEAAGYDVVMVETVGVGQSEVAVAGMVDTYLLVAVTGAGDDLQGVKKGILELADVMAVNKADGDNAPRARQAAEDFSKGLELVSAQAGERTVPVLTCSALEGTGLEEVWQAVVDHRHWLEGNGSLAGRRAAQQHEWMWNIVRNSIVESLRKDPVVAGQMADIEADLGTEATEALDGAQQVLETLARRVPEQAWAHGRPSAG
ncbi:MAG: methylmalonyl Co-A mutase-associated GTPase MeaB [Acidipropionibacterium acidipropionici]